MKVCSNSHKEVVYNYGNVCPCCMFISIINDYEKRAQQYDIEIAELQQELHSNV